MLNISNTFLKSFKIYLRSNSPSVVVSKIALFFTVINITLGLLSWFFLSNMFSASKLLENYGMDFTSFLVWGVVFNSFLLMSSSLKRLPNFVYSVGYKRLVMSRTEPFLFHIVYSILTVLSGAVTWTLLQVIVAALIFKVKIPSLYGLLLSIIVASIGFIAETSFEIILDSLPILFDKLRYYPKVVPEIFQTVSTIASSIYYPIEALPLALQCLSYILPKGVTIQCIRYCLILNQQFINYLFILIAENLLLLPITYIILRKVVKKAEKEGLKYTLPA